MLIYNNKYTVTKVGDQNQYIVVYHLCKVKIGIGLLCRVTTLQTM